MNESSYHASTNDTLKNMEFRLKHAIELLRRTPGVLDAMLRGQPEEWLNCRMAEGTFSPVDILGHLVHGELTDWIPRAEIIMNYGETRTFTPFDRHGFGELIEGRSPEDLLSQFAVLRARNLEALDAMHLDEAMLDRTGMHPDPAIGRVTMRNLLATWVVHDLGHIDQLVRVMSNEYRGAVGPWIQYLSILGSAR